MFRLFFLVVGKGLFIGGECAGNFRRGGQLNSYDRGAASVTRGGEIGNYCPASGELLARYVICVYEICHFRGFYNVVGSNFTLPSGWRSNISEDTRGRRVCDATLKIDKKCLMLSERRRFMALIFCDDKSRGGELLTSDIACPPVCVCVCVLVIGHWHCISMRRD